MLKMLNRRRLTVLALLLTLALTPGLSLAAGRNLRAADQEGPVERLLTWVERAWDALTGGAPAAPSDSALTKVGCGIDPNGNCGIVLNSTGGH